MENGEWTMVSGQWDLASEYLLFNKREKEICTEARKSEGTYLYNEHMAL